MKKTIPCLGISIIFMTIALSGCQEEGATVKKEIDHIVFDSDILEIYNGTVNFEKDRRGNVIAVEALIYFKNIIENGINNLKLQIEFCDNNDNVLYMKPYQYNSVFPAGYRERLANRFYYDGEDAGKVDHIHVRIVDYTIVEA